MTLLLQGAGIQALTASAPPDPPLFVSAEVGNVDALTVVVTFDRDVTAAENDFLSGVTIKVNGSAATLISGIRQTNHAVVYYALTSAVISSDAVTWEYAAASGLIVSESDNIPLDDVSAQSVTNNVAPLGALLLDLQADLFSLTDGDPVSVWPDQSTYHHDFTQTGSARPTYKATDSDPAALLTPCVHFDGVDDFMDGGAGGWCNNLDNFTVIMVTGYGAELLAKISDTSTGAGWLIKSAGIFSFMQEAGGNNWIESDVDSPPDPPLSGGFVSTIEFINKSSTKVWLNSSLQTITDNSEPPVNNYSSPDHILIGKYTEQTRLQSQQFQAIRIYSGVLSDIDRASIEATLATRYGITL